MPVFTTKGGGFLGQNSSTPSLGPKSARSSHIPCDPRQTDAGALQPRMTSVGRHDSPALSPPTALLEALGNLGSSLGEARKALFAVSSLGAHSCKCLLLSRGLKVQMSGEPSSCRGTETVRSCSRSGHQTTLGVTDPHQELPVWLCRKGLCSLGKHFFFY